MIEHTASWATSALTALTGSGSSWLRKKPSAAFFHLRNTRKRLGFSIFGIGGSCGGRLFSQSATRPSLVGAGLGDFESSTVPRGPINRPLIYSTVARPRGFSMIELLVVVAVIGVLTGLLLAVLQRVRESSRNTTCRNNLFQLGKAIATAESANGRFNSGGWAGQWLGDSSRGSEGKQPGGWAFQLLPYLEELPLWDSLASVPSGQADVRYRDLAKYVAPVLSCPSRRTGSTNLTEGLNLYPMSGNQIVASRVFRSDYAANGGSSGLCPKLAAIKGTKSILGSSRKVKIAHFAGNGKCIELMLPISAVLEGHGGHPLDRLGGCDEEQCNGQIDDIIYVPRSVSQGDAMVDGGVEARLTLSDGGIPDLQDGLTRRMRQLGQSDVLDGLSRTYLLGEKNVRSDAYETTDDSGDVFPAWSGYSASNIRWARKPPIQDEWEVEHPSEFGSAHYVGANMVMADGAVLTVNYDIDAAVHAARASINDGR